MHAEAYIFTVIMWYGSCNWSLSHGYICTCMDGALMHDMIRKAITPYSSWSGHLHHCHHYLPEFYISFNQQAITFSILYGFPYHTTPILQE